MPAHDIIDNRQEKLQDYEDLRFLREAKETERDTPTIGIDDLKKKINK